MFVFILFNIVSLSTMAINGDYTIDRERFTGLNILGFSTIEVFAKIFSRCLGHKYSLFCIIKERHLYSLKIFRSTPENHEKHGSLAQQIFPHLRYIV